MTTLPIFHVAFPVTDLGATARFYASIGGTVGRANAHAVTVSLGGHQLVGHLVSDLPRQRGIYPRHFGLVFDHFADLEALHARLEEVGADVDYRRRFDGTPIAHWTMVTRDPSGNVLEFKCYDDKTALFGHIGIALLGDTETT